MISKTNFQLKKDGSPKKHCFCTHPELIENYDLAIADKERIWICHHKKEEFYTRQELIDLDLYYNVLPEDLVFVRDQEEHFSWPHKGSNERFTEEVRLKISEAHKGKPSWNKGKKGVYSEESRKKMSEAQRGKPSWNKGKRGIYSEETKERMSKNHANRIKVQCVETRQVFESIGKAISFIGLKDNGSIRRVLDKPGLTAGGYHWRQYVK